MVQPPDQRRVARWLSGTVTGIFFVAIIVGALFGGLIQANVTKFAEKKGHDGYLVAWWDSAVEWLSFIIASPYFFVMFGFSLGTTATLWLVRKYPDLDGPILAGANRLGLRFPSAATRKKSTPSDPDARISFYRLKEIAAQDFGWDFSAYSNQVLSLADGVRQACIDGDIVLWGRRMSATLPDDMKDKYPLQRIPPEHLADWWINPLSPTDSNLHTETYNSDPNYGNSNYRDLHLSPESAARRWLKSKGLDFRTPQPDVDAEKALIHITHHSAVGDRVGAQLAFEEMAASGKLQVWGKQHVHPHGLAAQDEVRPSHWSLAQLDLNTFILFERPRNNAKEYEHANKTSQATVARGASSRTIEIYEGLRVNKAQVLRLWPRTRSGSPLE